MQLGVMQWQTAQVPGALTSEVQHQQLLVLPLSLFSEAFCMMHTQSVESSLALHHKQAPHTLGVQHTECFTEKQQLSSEATAQTWHAPSLSEEAS